MQRLDKPCFTAREALLLCHSGIGIKAFGERVRLAIDELASISDFYETQSSSGQLFTITPLSKDHPEISEVAAGITKKEFISLYETHLVGRKKPGREVYDNILVSAKDKCPFCGGIGVPKNIDHFLPKNLFPQFSVLPLNLIPSCRDCNMGEKGEGYASIECNQFIHPYIDDDCFFADQWVFAKVVEKFPCSVEYFANPPETWNTIKALRAKYHFKKFDLAKRYEIRSCDQISTVIYSRATHMKHDSANEFRIFLESASNTPLFTNHWKKVLLKGLSASEWFCNEKFDQYNYE